MVVFIYTFVLIFLALVMILGLGNLIMKNSSEEEPEEGEATAAMCTSQLLGRTCGESSFTDEDFVIEQDMVYTYDSFNL